jgi:Amt family ammonium transporter
MSGRFSTMRLRPHFKRRLFTLATASLIMVIFGTNVFAQTEADPVNALTNALANTQASLDNVWVLLTGFLVFFMQAGFAMLETGMIRKTGAVNALVENFVDAGVTAVAFWAVGFGIAFGTSTNGWFGTSNFFLSDAMTISNGIVSYSKFALYPNLDVYTMFFFQFAFAATASTITTGAMAERTNFIGDMIYSIIMAGFTYPVIVHWVWGGGWLGMAGFHDFAGSTVVHTVGGITALVGAWILGPRKVRVGANGEWKPMPPAHNLGLATIGAMILWLGWYGFNPGSTLGTGNTGLIGLVTVNTTLAAGAGMITAMLVQYFRTEKWDLGFIMNGALAGLVSITAGCAFVAPSAAVIIGAIGGVIVVYAVQAVESARIDDPVSAFAVHGAAGMWGTVAIGLFGMPGLTYNFAASVNGGLFNGGGFSLLGVQTVGVLAVVISTALFSMIIFGTLKFFKRLRVVSVVDDVHVFIDDFEHGASIMPDVRPVPLPEPYISVDEIPHGEPYLMR